MGRCRTPTTGPARGTSPDAPLQHGWSPTRCEPFASPRYAAQVTTLLELDVAAQGALLARRAVAGMAEAERAAERLADATYLLVAARGSSDNAARYFQYLAGQVLGKVVALATPSLYGPGSTMDLAGAGVIAISQSGRSPGIAEVAQLAKDQGRPVIGVTNDPTSPLAVVSDVVLSISTGPEVVVASTKTFSATWQALSQLVSAMAPSPIAGLEQLPARIERVASWALGADLGIGRFDAAAGITVVGRGVGYSVADEVSLKIREVAGVRAESYAVADYLHGPIGADGANCSLLLIVTDELTDAVATAAIEGSRAAGMTTLALYPADRVLEGTDAVIVLPEEMENWSVGLAQVVVGQVLALRLGQRYGRPIDAPPRLAKVTLSA